MAVITEKFGITSDGCQVNRYVITNKNGMQAAVLDYGAILQSLFVPDRNGEMLDVVRGFDDIAGYETTGAFFGATVGRNANRIGGASFEIDGRVYMLEKNDNDCNNLHSGSRPWSKRLWKVGAEGEDTVMLALASPDGDQGFPGNADVRVSFTLTDDNALRLRYEAKADQDTIFNMTNHSYFNLEGPSSDDVLDHIVCVDADRYTPVDEMLIPTGLLAGVEGTPFDFRTPTGLGERIGSDHPQMTTAGGYDHNFVLNKGSRYGLCASAFSEKSGIWMDVYTDLPGLQLYSSNFPDGKKGGRDGRTCARRSAVCFETQYFPDAPHHKNFASSIVKAGTVYSTVTAYRFTAISGRDPGDLPAHR